MTMAQVERVDPLEETAEWLSDVAHDPVAFVKGAFPWGEGEFSSQLAYAPSQSSS